MSQTERLREALLEIEVLRAREQDALRETRALLDILSITTSGGNPMQALRSALIKSAATLNAEVVAIVRIADDHLVIETATDRELEGWVISIDSGFFTKPRNIVDTSKVPKLKPLLSHPKLSIGSLLTSPLEGQLDQTFQQPQVLFVEPVTAGVSAKDGAVGVQLAFQRGRQQAPD